MKLIRCNKPSWWDLSADAAYRKLKHTANNVSSLRDFLYDTPSVSKLKHNVVNLIVVQKSRRDDTLLAVCFSLRKNEVSKGCSQIWRKICYTLLISHH
jgi:hypothetical protein